MARAHPASAATCTQGNGHAAGARRDRCRHHGWGEGFGFTLVETTKDAVDRLIGPACIGQDASDIAGVTRMLARRFHNFGRNGAVTFRISAIDIALWDIRAKAAGRPLHALLGDAGRTLVPAYASLLRYGAPEDVARNVTEALSRGYRHIKLHEVDLRASSRARDAAPREIPLMLDIPTAPGTPRPRRCSSARTSPAGTSPGSGTDLAARGHPAIARIRAASPVPISAGECNGTVEDFCRMFETRAVDVAQPDG